MNILHIFKTYYPETYGGIEQVIDTICSAHSKDYNFRVMTLTRGNQRMENINGYDVYFYPLTFELSSNGISLSFIRDYSKHVEWADIIHFHYPWPFADLCYLITKISKNKKILVTYHSDIVKQKIMYLFYKPFETLFLNSADSIISTSKNYADSSRNLIKFKHKVKIIPLGVENIFRSSIQNSVVKKNDIEGKKFFLFVGVLRYYKGLTTLIEALVGTDFEVVLAGDGPEKNKLQELAKSLGVEQQIKFWGRISENEKKYLLSTGYAFIFPSNMRTEAFGISLLEASMSKLPMISCDISTGTSFINIDGETGYVVPPNDPESLKNAMQKLWDCPEQAKIFGEKAFQRYQKLFTAKIMVEKYKKVYKNLIID